MSQAIITKLYEIWKRLGDGSASMQLSGSNMEYFGKSTDTKPTSDIKIGSTFFEIDTTVVYMWDGTTWVVV